MKSTIDLLFEAHILKHIPRTGYHFLGVGKETVAEHSFICTFIAYVISKLEPEADALKLITMCLLHDLPESRIGDLNAVHKKYVTPDEGAAIEDALRGLPFGGSFAESLREFNENKTLEARLAHDADQLAFILDLKSLSDVGYDITQKWLPGVASRLKTETGKKLCENILDTEWDAWWLKKLC